MPIRPTIASDIDQASAVLDEAMRRVVEAVPVQVDRDALRQALETEMAKGVTSLVGLMKVGRRRALARVARAKRKAADRC